jgi:hypothetical protein
MLLLAVRRKTARDADSELSDQIYAKSLIANRSLRGTRGYKPALSQRMRPKNEIVALWVQRYRSSLPVIQHFLDDYIATSEKRQRLLPQQIFSRPIHTNVRQKVSEIQSIALLDCLCGLPA